MSAAPLGLAGRTFLSTAVTEGGVPRPMPAGSRVMVWFSADGRLVASAGCNSIQGTRWVLSALVGGNLMVADAAEPSRVFPPLSIGRAVAITDKGREALRKHLGLATGWRRGG